MDPDVPETLVEALHRQATNALTRGKDPAAVDAHLAQMSNGAFSSYAQIERTVQAGPTAIRFAQESMDEAPSRAQERLVENGSGAGDFGLMAAQSAGMGFLPELVGLFDEDKATAMQQRLDDLQALNPAGATIPAQLAGAASLPMGMGMRAARGGTLWRAAGAGMATGGVVGAATGIGEAEGSPLERLPSAVIPGLIGAATGALGVPVAKGIATGAQKAIAGPLGRRVATDLLDAADEIEAPGVFGRIGDMLRGRPNIQRTFTTDALRQQLVNQSQEIAEEVYGPLNGVKPSAMMERIVEQMRRTPGVRAVVQDPGLRYLDEDLTLGSARQIRNKLRAAAEKEANGGNPGGTFNRLAQRWDEEMQVTWDGLKEADRAFAMGREQVEAFDMGYNRARRAGTTRAKEGISGFERAPDLREMIRTFDANPAAQAEMRRGIRQRIVEDLIIGGDNVPQELAVFMSPDIGGEALMREMFEQGPAGTRAFNQFKEAALNADRPEIILQQLEKGAKAGVLAAVAAAAMNFMRNTTAPSGNSGRKALS